LRVLMNNLFCRVSDRSRQRKLDLFNQFMRPTPQARILDLGGEAAHSPQSHKQLLDTYPYRRRVVLVNLHFASVKHAAAVLPEIAPICGDGLMLPFSDKTFDVCYCNAVVEHLFTWENQQRFAAEIMRVARSWFVTTPNRWFPFEPHLRLPLVTWLPQSWQHRVGYRFGYNHLAHRYMSGSDRRDIRLLSCRELRKLFPGSLVLRNRVTGLTPTFIAVGGEVLKEAAERRGVAQLRSAVTS
jgi:hypothetical protein